MISGLDELVTLLAKLPLLCMMQETQARMTPDDDLCVSPSHFLQDLCLLRGICCPYKYATGLRDLLGAWMAICRLNPTWR